MPPEAYTDENFFKKCEMEFNSLKKDTMVLVEEAKKQSAHRPRPYEDQFKTACSQLGASGRKLSSNSYIKKRFTEIKTLLDNTAVIHAYPHQATVFKCGVTYKSYSEEKIGNPLANLLVASLEEEIPDRCKRVAFDNSNPKKTRSASYLEMAEKCLEEAENDLNPHFREMFNDSYERFSNAAEIGDREDLVLEKQLYHISLSETDPVETNLYEKYKGEIPKEAFPLIPEEAEAVESEKRKKEEENFKQKLKELEKKSRENSDKTYEKLTETDLLERLIPRNDSRPTFTIPPLVGIHLTTYMQKCLFKIQKIDKRQTREARDEFIVRSTDRSHKARSAMDGEKRGDVVDPSIGYAAYDADPANIVNEIDRLKKNMMRIVPKRYRVL
uniref:Uncharacterized protein n=1 Tax=Coxiella burnetii TaxID=777 RepID=Q45939_COXBE|nr:unnamed protein product [Coxiella burnetii]